MSRTIYEVDPLGLGNGDNTDEYDPEAGTILRLLPHVRSEAEALTLVHQTFVKWFGAETAGPQSRYLALSERIWKVWQSRNKNAR
jgi:hypothetical protein